MIANLIASFRPNMDKYLIKRPRSPKEETAIKPAKKRYKQATIESLQGVVVVEDILRCKALLKVPHQKPEVLLNSLTQLDAKIPARDLLKSTKIGHTVNHLTTHSNSEVARRAQELVDKWKAFYVAKLERPQIEVKCDKKTEDLRKKGRTLLADAMQTDSEAAKRLAEAIERETYMVHGRLVGQAYRRNIRHLVFALKNQENERKNVVLGETSVSDFVKSYNKQLVKS